MRRAFGITLCHLRVIRLIVALLFIFPLLAGFSSPALAGTTIHVPADQPTIQAGINAAINGDTVLVSPGTYYENINFDGKAITVKSASGPAGTIIDGQLSGAVVTFSAGESPTSVINGFTIRNAGTTGISVGGASPTITGNVISGNSACGGSGISISGGSPLITRNLISNNGLSTCAYYGYAGIISSDDNGVQVEGNVISGNWGTGIGLYPVDGKEIIDQNTITFNSGGGFFVYGQNGSTSTLTQNVIFDNQGTGVSWVEPPITLVSNTIAGNTASCCGNYASEISGSTVDSTVSLQNNLVIATGTAPALYCYYLSSSPTLDNNDIFAANNSAYSGECTDATGTNGNLSVDPLFTDLLGDNVHLQSVSPVIKAGTISAPGEPKTDIDGDPRIINGAIDIGADEYKSPSDQTLSSYLLNFGTQDVSTASAPQIVTLVNNGKTPTRINLIATGSNFSQINNCGASLAAGASCQINVTFSPVVGGVINGVLGVFTSATLNPEAVTLVGTGLAPQIQVGCCLYFYGQIVGTTSTGAETITNTGQAPLLISSITYSGTTDFVETNNCPISPNSVAVGAYCTLTVSYTPTIVGSESGTIAVASNTGVPQVLYLNGSGVSAGSPVFSPTSLTYPATLIGQSSSTQTATLTNSGTGPLGILEIYGYGDFSETNNCPTTLAVNASCAVSVTYTPSVQGTETSNVTVYTDSLNGYGSLAVTGTGQAPVPTISSLSFSSVPAGSSDTQVTITGTGFVAYSSQVLWNGTALTYCCTSFNGTTQLTFTIPAGDMVSASTDQISILTPAPGGGTSNSLPFTVYTPVNYAFESTPYIYSSITGTNLNLFLYDYAQITSPFPIQFGGGSYTLLTISPGGTISFNGYANPYPEPIPTNQVPMIIAPFWENLYPFGATNSTDNNVFWEVTGTAPNRQLVVEWRNVGLCCETTNTVKFEVVFSEGNSNVVFNYADTVFGGAYSNNDNGATASVGNQVAPNLGTQFSYYQPSVFSGTAQLWYPSSPTATLSTSSVSFGYHQIGSSTLPQSLTLTNGGLVPLNISSIAIDNADFTEANNCGNSVAAHESCSLRVFFKPSQPTTETATLTIIDNATNSPQTVSLTGTGTVTSIVVYPILVNFGGVTVGKTGIAPVTLANASNTPLTVQEIFTSPSVYTETNNCGSSVAPGMRCTVTVAFTPTRKGSAQGTLSMALNGTAATVEANLTGSGQ